MFLFKYINRYFTLPKNKWINIQELDWPYNYDQVIICRGSSYGASN